MSIKSDNWAELLTPGLRAIFGQHQREMKDYIPLIFNVETSTKASEQFLGTGELGIMDEWEGKVSYEDFDKGFKAIFAHKKYSKGMQLERELVDDDQYAEIKNRTKKLSRVTYYTRQIHAASVFNNANNGGFVGPDGKPLCATDHPKMPGSSSTFSNKGTLELTADNVETTRTEALKWTDDKDNKILTQLDTLIVPSALRKKAMIIAETDEEPDTTEHGINVWKGNLKVIEWPFLTNPKAWFMIDSARAKEELLWFDRRKPDFANQVDFDTEIAKYKVIGRWSYGYLSPLWIYGNFAA